MYKKILNLEASIHMILCRLVFDTYKIIVWRDV